MVNENTNILIEPMLLYVHTVSMLDEKDISITHQRNTVAGAGFRVPFTCGLSCCIHAYRGLGHVSMHYQHNSTTWTFMPLSSSFCFCFFWSLLSSLPGLFHIHAVLLQWQQHQSVYFPFYVCLKTSNAVPVNWQMYKSQMLLQGTKPLYMKTHQFIIIDYKKQKKDCCICSIIKVKTNVL